MYENNKSALLEDLGLIPSTQWWLTAICNSGSKERNALSGLHRCQHAGRRDIPAGKTATHKKKFFLKRIIMEDFRVLVIALPPGHLQVGRHKGRSLPESQGDVFSVRRRPPHLS